MKYFPVFFDLHGKRVLVVGGGDVAARKVSLLFRAGAEVNVVSPELCESLQNRVANNEITHVARTFEDADIEACALIVAGTDDQATNKHVSDLAHANCIPVNVVDQPELCSFIVPSIIDRSPVQVAVSTGGASPVLARLLRARLETLIPSAYGRSEERRVG